MITRTDIFVAAWNGIFNELSRRDLLDRLVTQRINFKQRLWRRKRKARSR